MVFAKLDNKNKKTVAYVRHRFFSYSLKFSE